MNPAQPEPSLRVPRPRGEVAQGSHLLRPVTEAGVSWINIGDPCFQWGATPGCGIG